LTGEISKEAGLACQSALEPCPYPCDVVRAAPALHVEMELELSADLGNSFASTSYEHVILNTVLYTKATWHPHVPHLSVTGFYSCVH
jgi:hypothetical protein